MSQPIELPLVGRKSFPANEVSKESLIGFWQEVRERTGLRVKEGVKFESLEKVDGIFKVRTSQGSITAKKVILAMGVRGSARKLGVPGEELSKVAYELIEPAQYQGRHIVIVGGGNSAAEAAQHLADPRLRNKVHLLVRGTSLDRANETNLRRVEALTKNGHLELFFETQLEAIKPDRVIITRGNNSRMTLKNDFVFIFAGSETPRAFLMSLGVRIDKIFGAKSPAQNPGEDESA